MQTHFAKASTIKSEQDNDVLERFQCIETIGSLSYRADGAQSNYERKNRQISINE